jgi:hypothetical protein
VARLLGDHGKGENAKLAIVKRPAAATTAEAEAVMPVMMPSVTAIRQVLGLGETTV